MKKITVKSYAKINLSIDVGKAQPNGFHDVDMLRFLLKQMLIHLSKITPELSQIGGNPGRNFRLNSPRIGFIFRQMKGIWHTEPLN